MKENKLNFIQAIILWCLFVVTGIAQTPVAHFAFDNACVAEDETGAFIANTTNGMPTCECGPVNNAMVFDGIDDFVSLDDGLKSVFEGNFTISFYFWGNNAPNAYNLLAVKKPDCIDSDSTMHVQYLPGPGVVEFNFNRNIGEIINFNMAVDQDICWHHVVIVKSGMDYSFYLDETFLQTINIGSVVPMADAATFFIGNTECIGLGEQLFDGMIDELQIFDSALNSDEIEALNVFPDKIITESTTIFEGESILVNTGGTCTNFAWSNPNDLDDPTSLNPTITPLETTSYIFLVDYGSCETSDTLLINVIDSQNLDCSNLLLPKAFTPNNDGLNDTYGISNDFLVESLDYFEIYDRWGTKLFSTNQLSDRWDGVFKGSQQIPGAYAYKIKYTCQSTEFLKSGNFSILR